MCQKLMELQYAKCTQQLLAELTMITTPSSTELLTVEKRPLGATVSVPATGSYYSIKCTQQLLAELTMITTPSSTELLTAEKRPLGATLSVPATGSYYSIKCAQQLLAELTMITTPSMSYQRLPKELLKTIDKCKFQQENLELNTVTALSLWRGGPQTLATCSKTCCLVLVLHLDKLCNFLVEITNLRISTDKVSELCAIINFICLTWLNTLLVAYPCMLKYVI